MSQEQVRPPAAAGRRARAASHALLVAAAVASLLVVIPGPADAESADEARARAEEARQRVAALQEQVDDARREYQRAVNGVAHAVSREVSAEEDLAVAQRAALVARQNRAAAIRALDQSGGSFGVLGSVLDAGSPSEFAARWKLSTDVVAMLTEESDRGIADVKHAATTASRRGETTDRVMVTVADVQDAYERLEAALDEQQDVLDALDERAKRLARAERIQARIEAERAAAAATASGAASEATASGIPVNFLKLYRAAAATCSGLPWPVLAAVGQVESGHGSNMGPSSSGAMGPMQFLPSTFAAYAVDGDGDGDKDIWDPADSIFSAARYLCANGAGAGPRGLYTALWHYNHEDWYVQLVIRVAGQIAVKFGEPIPTVEPPS